MSHWDHHLSAPAAQNKSGASTRPPTSRCPHTWICEVRAVLAARLAILSCKCIRIGLPLGCTNICGMSMPASWHASTYVYTTKIRPGSAPLPNFGVYRRRRLSSPGISGCTGTYLHLGTFVRIAAPSFYRRRISAVASQGVRKEAAHRYNITNPFMNVALL